MWPFKRKQLNWISVAKKVKKTIHVSDDTSVVGYVWEYYTKLPEWNDASNSHFELRAAYWDTKLEGKSDYLNITTDDGVVAVRKSAITKIVYKVVEGE